MRLLTFTGMNATFPKAEKLKSKKHITQLFTEGKSIKKFPLRFVYLPFENSEQSPHRVGVSVPKRNFKKAVERNLLKRRMREAYRLNKYQIADTPQHYVIMVLYTGRNSEDFSKINTAMAALLQKLKTQ